MHYDLDGLTYKTYKTQGKQPISYVNIECAFDIETTSTQSGSGESVAFMYAWCLGIKDSNHLFYGRTWEEFLELCRALQEHFNLDENKRLIVYVHNLGFEFQFMRKYFNWTNVFSTDSRKPLSAVTDLGIEFRDSYILAGCSLKTVAKNLAYHDIKKLTGDLDYSLVRHAQTEITAQEWDYITNDVLIVLYYINEQMKIYSNNITKIPMTNTSRVRKFVKHNCYYTDKSHNKSDWNKYYKYRDMMNALQLTTDSYEQARDAFMGGYVHANRHVTDYVIKDVTSIDIISSYPAVMVSEKFPMSKPIPIDLNKNKDFDFYSMVESENHNMIFTITFNNIISDFQFDNYLSESKCNYLKGEITDNGRVFSADELETTITDVDFKIINSLYDWDSAEISNVYMFYSGYLPKDIIKSITELYKSKTELKGLEDYKLEYTQSKAMLNSVYGMTVTDINKDNAVYDEDWDIEETDVNKNITLYNNSKNRFLYYPWGVFITAYARLNLWNMIYSIGEDYIYADTDSIKMTNYSKHKDKVLKYNAKIIEKTEAVCEHYDIDINKLQPKTKEGYTKPIGIWTVDGEYSRFKTLGAKKYMSEDKATGKLEIAVSGLGKQAGINYLKNKYGSNTAVLDAFNEDLYIPAEHTGKISHSYIDNEKEFTITDYLGNTHKVVAKSGIYLENDSFTLNETNSIIKFIENLKKGKLLIKA